MEGLKNETMEDRMLMLEQLRDYSSENAQIRPLCLVMEELADSVQLPEVQ